jgi:hypothetical protein
MTTISIQSMFPLSVPLLAGAIDRERRIVNNSIKTTKRRLEALSKSLGVDTLRLMAGEVVHDDSNDMDLIELEGELALLQHLESEHAALESVHICT